MTFMKGLLAPAAILIIWILLIVGTWLLRTTFADEDGETQPLPAPVLPIAISATLIAAGLLAPVMAPLPPLALAGFALLLALLVGVAEVVAVAPLSWIAPSRDRLRRDGSWESLWQSYRWQQVPAWMQSALGDQEITIDDERWHLDSYGRLVPVAQESRPGPGSLIEQLQNLLPF